MHPARWSAFFCLLGLSALLPAYFIPAMLVANAIDGSKYFSVWTGIETFWERKHHFLAGLIFTFSFLFPLAKFGLCLLCAVSERLFPPRFRKGIITLTEATAKYSMLDVFVIAMLILLVKVEESVRILPGAGLYLFTFAIFCSTVAGAFLQRALHPKAQALAALPPRSPKASLLRRIGYVPWLIAGVAAAACGVVLLVRHAGGHVTTITLENFTKRPVPRTMEKLSGLRVLADEEHDFWSKDTWKRFVETFQAATTDLGWSDAEGFLQIELKNGRVIETGHMPVNFDDPALRLTFPLPETIAMREINGIRFKSKVKYVGFVPAESEEEFLSVANDPYRTWTETWPGRIFQFHLHGPPNPEFRAGLWILAGALILTYWAGSGVLCGKRPRAAVARGPQASESAQEGGAASNVTGSIVNG